MSLIRADIFLPQYVANVAVDSSTPYVSDVQLLNGSATVTLQFVCTNGAAGTCYAEATNFETTDPNIVWVPCQSFVLSANTQGAMVFSGVDQLTGMHAMRIRFVPSAAGNVRVAANFRHYAH